MTGLAITYRVVGRYMDGKEILGYHFIGSDNSDIQLNKERTIYMIGKGLIENMRIQTVNGEIIIRGKGINLNKLPVYDEGKNEYRNTGASRVAASSSVHGKNTSIRNNMAQYKVTKRIMQKNNCIAAYRPGKLPAR